MPGYTHQSQTSPPSKKASLLIRLVMPSIFIVELSAYMAPARIQGKKKECSLIEIGHTMGLLLANKAMPPSDRVRLSARIAALRYASGANSVIVHV